MAYATYNDYIGLWYGDAIDVEIANKWLERASSEIDVLTFGRLSKNGLPTQTYYVNQIKKATCAIADALYGIDVAQTAAQMVQTDGMYHGPVSSINSGKESISFATGTSSYSKAASSLEEKDAMINEIACRYLANVPDSTGINLLYAGASGYV